MGAGHAHALYVHEHSLVHRLAPEAKLAATLVFVVAVAVTPREAIWAFLVYGAILTSLTLLSRIRLSFVLIRLAAVLPFIAFAFLIPFVASGDQVDVWGLTVSRDGLWGMWNIVAKATLGATTSILLAATTEVPELIRAMGLLKVPPVLTSVAGFMIRYLELIADEMRRMRVAMSARGYDPRWLWQSRPIASAAGAMFVRSYERGERIYGAMLSRGFTGRMPDLNRRRAELSDWLTAGVLPLMGVSTAVVALLST